MTKIKTIQQPLGMDKIMWVISGTSGRDFVDMCGNGEKKNKGKYHSQKIMFEWMLNNKHTFSETILG